MRKQFVITFDDNLSENDGVLLAEQLRQWVLYKKTSCQSKLNETNIVTRSEIDYESKQRVPSETSDNTTPTITFQFDHNALPLSTRYSHHNNNNNSNSFGLGNISVDTTCVDTTTDV